MPGEWAGLPAFRRLLVLRALKPDRVPSALQLMCEEVMGPQYTNQEAFRPEAVLQVGPPGGGGGAQLARSGWLAAALGAPALLALGCALGQLQVSGSFRFARSPSCSCSPACRSRAQPRPSSSSCSPATRPAKRWRHTRAWWGARWRTAS